MNNDTLTNDTVRTRPSEALSAEQLLQMFWWMLLSRRVDERAWVIHRQGRIAFHISAIGHEAIQAAMAATIHRQVDYIAPYYRDLTLMLACGMTPLDFMISLMGKSGELSSKARQMPSHFSDKDSNIVSTSAVVTTQLLHAAGLAFAINYKLKNGMQDPHDTNQPRLALTAVGDGSTSQGDFHEALNWAGVHHLPWICVVQNNQYAISVPLKKQMPTPDIVDRCVGYNIATEIVDGMDVLACYDAMHAAVQRAYQGEGATLIEAKTYRITPHSSDDDDRTYRSREEVEHWKRKDPLPRFQNWLFERGTLTDEKLAEMEDKARAMVDQAVKDADAAPYPPAEAALASVFAEVK